MFKKNSFSSISLTITLLLLSISQMNFADTFKFPEKIKYEIQVQGKMVHSDFSNILKTVQGIPSYQLSLGNFEAMGFQSNDKIFTIISQKDLSFSRTMLMRGKEKIYEMKAKKGPGIFEDEADIFVYTEKTLSGQIETESYIPVIDFLSLFLVASEKAASGKTEIEKFNFFNGNNSIFKVVELSYIGKEIIPIKCFEGILRETLILTTLLELSYQGIAIIKINIYKGEDGFHFPVQITINDDSKGLVKFMAIKAF